MITWTLGGNPYAKLAKTSISSAFLVVVYPYAEKQWPAGFGEELLLSHSSISHSTTNLWCPWIFLVVNTLLISLYYLFRWSFIWYWVRFFIGDDLSFLMVLTFHFFIMSFLFIYLFYGLRLIVSGFWSESLNARLTTCCASHCEFALVYIFLAYLVKFVLLWIRRWSLYWMDNIRICLKTGTKPIWIFVLPKL